MKSNVTYLTVATLLGALQMASAAELSGKVKLNGTPKAEMPIPLDATCGKLQPGPVTTRHYVVGADKGLGNVFVYVKSTDLKAPPAGEAQMLDQAGCFYEPYVMGVVAGQKFKIRNSDPLLHNVHSTPKPGTGNKEFNFAQTSKGQVNEKQFDNPEVLVRLKCDVHAWMFAYVGVCTHPYFAVTDKDGNFKISGLPAGKYTIEAFHLKAGAKTQDIEVGADDKKSLEFTLDAPAQ